MSVWTHFKIKENTKNSKVSIRRLCHTILEAPTGGEFNVSKEPDNLGWYSVSVCLCGNECFSLLQDMVELGRLLDARSNINIEITYAVVY